MSDNFAAGFTRAIDGHRRMFDRFAAESGPALYSLSHAVADCLQGGGKLLTFGNGGSAAQAQEMAAECVNRFRAERPAYAALALTADGPVITSIANDADYAAVFSRQIEALGRRGDLALAFSTSGRSQNVLRGLQTAREQGLVTAGLLGADGGAARALCDFPLTVPSQDTARVQEMHLLALHVICDHLERQPASTAPGAP